MFYVHNVVNACAVVGCWISLEKDKDARLASPLRWSIRDMFSSKEKR
jgi:hypothetical protein